MGRAHREEGPKTPMAVVIAPERPDTADARALIDELEAHLEPQYPGIGGR